MQLPTHVLALGLASVLFGGLPSAQGIAPKPRSTTAVRHATLNLATGQITPGQPSNKVARLAASFSNTDTSGFFSGGSLVSTMGNPTEWLDWGVIPTDTGSDIVGEFDFGYATTQLGPNNGGPGAQMTLRFYDGVVGLCADSGLGIAPTASFSFTGLPGVTVSGSNAWVITVELQGGFEFSSAGAGNAFGFGLTTTDTPGGNAWGTGPLLCYAGDGAGGTDTNGQVDLFDIYDGELQSGICSGSFFFGGPPFDFSSWYLELRTAAPDPGGADDWSVTQTNGTGTNPNNFIVSNGLQLGGSFSATDMSTNGGLGVFLVGYLTPLVFPTAFGEILVNLADPTGELYGGAGANGPYLFSAGVASIAFGVPSDLSLCGIAVESQTLEFGAGLQLHNANSCRIGF